MFCFISRLHSHGIRGDPCLVSQAELGTHGINEELGQGLGKSTLTLACQLLVAGCLVGQRLRFLQ